MTARSPLRLLIGSLLVIGGVWMHAVVAQEPEEQSAAAVPQPRSIGRVVTIMPPLNEQLNNRLRRVVSQLQEEIRQTDAEVRPVLILRLEPGVVELGQAYDLANYLSGDALAGITTIAYVPRQLTGHMVAVALACDQIVLHPDAELGQAGVSDPRISAATRSFYRELAARKRTIPEAVALGLLDDQLEVFEVETEVSREFVLAEDLPDLKERRSIQSENVLFRPGEPHFLTATQGRRLGFYSRLAPDVAAVALAAGLTREDVQEDPSLGDSWRAVRVVLEGPLSPAVVHPVRRMIERAVRDENVNLIIVDIDSTGGASPESMLLAHQIARIDPSQCRTVAYIRGDALYDAAFIALACDQIIMQDGTVLGGANSAAEESFTSSEATAYSLEEIAKRKLRSPGLVTAMANPELNVFRYERPRDGVVEYLTPEDAEQLEDVDQWQRTAEISRPGELLSPSAEEAVTLRLASQRVTDFEQFKQLYHLESDPRLLEPGWADQLLTALRNPAVAWFLLVIGGAALFAELQAPGFGVGGFIAMVCFFLYFWAMHLGGTAGWLEVMLFVTGVVCLLIEVFALPGFGVFGIGGILLIAASIILGSQTFIVPLSKSQFVQLSQSIFMAASVLVGVLVAAMLVRKVIPHTPAGRAIILDGGTPEERAELDRRETIVRWDHLLGERGIVVTRLNPSGKVRFGEEMVDVISNGDLVPAGAEVEVIEARGNRVVVRAVA